MIACGWCGEPVGGHDERDRHECLVALSILVADLLAGGTLDDDDPPPRRPTAIVDGRTYRHLFGRDGPTPPGTVSAATGRRGGLVIVSDRNVGADPRPGDHRPS